MRVCILGNNLSSLTLAKALVNLKIHVDILFSKKSYLLNQTRTIGISKSNLEFFNKNIINIKKIIWEIKKIEIYSDNMKRQRLINFENKNDHLFSIVKNYKLQLILDKKLKKNKYFKIINPKKNINYKEDYDIVFNTDYNNVVTKKYFNKKIEKLYNSYAYTTIIRHEKIANDVAIQIFTKNGPIAFLPISNTSTSIVYSIHNSKDTKKLNITDSISYYNPKYKIKKINNIESFELKSFILRSYYYKNILAFGDLLHRLHPLAGQGFNMTVRDVKLLLEIIKEKKNLGLPLDSSINQKFEKKLRHKNYIFLNSIDFIHEFFNLDRKFKNKILGKTVQRLGRNSFLNKFFTKIADKGISY